MLLKLCEMAYPADVLAVLARNPCDSDGWTAPNQMALHSARHSSLFNTNDASRSRETYQTRLYIVTHVLVMMLDGYELCRYASQGV